MNRFVCHGKPDSWIDLHQNIYEYFEIDVVIAQIKKTSRLNVEVKHYRKGKD